MATIGVRELKNQTTEVLRDVREQQAEYIVTYRGQPVALLLPLGEENRQKLQQPSIVKPKPTAALLAELEMLRQKIGRAWRTKLTAAEAVAEQRRTL